MADIRLIAHIYYKHTLVIWQRTVDITN